MYQKWLQVFHAVATEGGFTAAARHLSIGQPTVSTHVKSLEEHFGVELFHRRGRSVELTSTGRALLTITKGLQGHEEEAVQLLNAAQGLQAGELRLCAIGPYDVMEILQRFRGHYPEIGLTVVLGTEMEVLRNLEEFRADIGLIGREVRDPRFSFTFYNRHRVLVIVSSAHPLARRKLIKLRQLEGQDMILRPAISTTRQAFESATAAAGVAVNPVMEINSREAVREAIIRGFGFGVMSESEFSPHPQLQALKVADAEMYTKAYIVCLKERQDRPLIAALLATANAMRRTR